MSLCEVPADPHFLPDENLYHRIQKSWLGEDGRLLPPTIRCPNPSVNRSKYSEPQDVLKPNWLDWGVVSIQVGDIPHQITSPGPTGIKYLFCVQHNPIIGNAAHCEIEAFKEGEPQRLEDIPSKEVKKKFRTSFARKANLVIPPKI